jgi:hypothetical protein
MTAADDIKERKRSVEEHSDDAATPDGEAGHTEAGQAEAGHTKPGQIEATGEPRVDQAMRRLGELDNLPVSEHPQVFERVHASLVDVLGELRSGAGEDRRSLS